MRVAATEWLITSVKDCGDTYECGFEPIGFEWQPEPQDVAQKIASHLAAYLPAPAPVSDNELLNYTEAAKYLKCSVAALQAQVHFKKIPYLKAGSLVRFRRSELDTWLSSSNIPLKRKIKPAKKKGKVAYVLPHSRQAEKYLLEHAKRKAGII